MDDTNTSTCIVGIVKNGTVCIGADSLGVNTGTLASAIRLDQKVFMREHMGTDWLFGFTSSFRMGQLLQYSLELPEFEIDDRHDVLGFLVSKFIPAVRKCFDAGGYELKKENRVSAGEFMVGIEGHLFVVGGDYQVGEYANGYCAIGCGAPYALGSLFATQDSKLSQKECALAALKAAEHFSAGVGGPFHIMSMGYKIT